jgi:transposase InsO family protein
MHGITPEVRKLIVKARRNGKRVKDIAEMFDVSRKTIWKRCKRVSKKGWPNYRDRSRKPHNVHKKVTPLVEEAILLLRDSFNWGTQRIKINLQSPPPHIRYLLETVLGEKWNETNLSRQTINNMLKKHRRNGSPYRKTRKDWKYFRANGLDDMWQIDIKGPFLLDGERVNALVILDDYSRFLVSLKLFKSITTEIVTQELNQCIDLYNEPNSILSDNGLQFREQFENWCNRSERQIEAVHSPPFYPQCKGKVERCIRNFNEEYIKTDKVFEDASTLLGEYREWYNNKRYNLGIQDVPVNLYLTKKCYRCYLTLQKQKNT